MEACQATIPDKTMPTAARSLPDMPALLRGVSRSFYLSIRLLPAPLRRPVAVAYLLARASDTLADTAELPATERQEKLEVLACAIDANPSPGSVAALARSFAPLQHDRAERALILALPQCLEGLATLPEPDQADVRAVLRKIIGGQALDIARFDVPGAMQALAGAAALDDYTYRVAGCVGEFWTELGFRHLPDFAQLPKPQMCELGRGFGMALQLVNILRDAGADLRAGRCYFPADELAQAGISPLDIAYAPERFEPVWQHWCARAQSGLDLGMRYAQAVNHRRVRAASALPALLGARTLALMKSAGPQRMARPVKMPRREVRSVMCRLALTFAAREALRISYERMRAQPAAA
jgi:farnesyl-diphosphate farnesyltransferase